MTLLYDGEVRIFRTLCGSDNNNAYLLVCPQTGESIIIDAPLGPERLLEEARGTTVKAILITHKHKDHLEGLKEAVEATGAPVGAHGEDFAYMPVSPDFLVKDGDTVRAGTIELRVIHTPGHTPGSVCFLAGRHLFTGDTVYSGGPGESWGPEATQQILKSITERLYVLPDDTLVLPGHGHHSILVVPKREYRVYLAEYPDLLPPIPGDASSRQGEELRGSVEPPADKAASTDESVYRERLTPLQYEVTREKGTEPAFTGEHLHTKDAGSYHRGSGTASTPRL